MSQSGGGTVTVKLCPGCDTDKPLEEFDKFAHRCKACRAGKSAPSKKAVVVAKTPKNSARPQWLASSNWSRPSGLGFDVRLEVDDLTKRTDIKLMQMTGDLGTQTVWLNQAEAREFHSWLTALLGNTA